MLGSMFTMDRLAWLVAGVMHLLMISPCVTTDLAHTQPSSHRNPSLLICNAATNSILQAGETFSQLLQEYNIKGRIIAQPGEHQLGIYATQPASKDDVLLTVPLSLCLYVNYQGAGLQLPVAGWPRLSQAVAKDDAMNWDLLMAVALLDALNGDGGPLWDAYANLILPSPHTLTHPVALPRAMLLELQHSLIIDAALEQKQRLKIMFPGFSVPMEEGPYPTYMEWASACVKSRALQLGPQAFAMVPFLDVANHASVKPTANFRLTADGEHVELVAMGRVLPGDEVTISYTGDAGMTNQRMMSQYGFVVEDGNPADRYPFDLAALVNASSHGGSHNGVPSGSLSSVSSASDTDDDDDARKYDGVDEGPIAAGLSLQYMQECLGDVICMDMLSGRNPYMFAALKSLPLLPESEDLYAAHVASLEPTTGGGGGIPSNNMSGGGGSGVGGSGVGGSGDSTSTLASGGGVGTSNGGGVVLGSGVRRWIAQRRDLDQATAEQLEATKRAAKLLLLQATTELRGFPSTLEADLRALWNPRQDPRMRPCIRYRYERKKLLSAAEAMLAVYCGDKTLV